MKRKKEMALWKGALRAYHKVRNDQRFQHHLPVIVNYLLNANVEWSKNVEEENIRLILWLRQCFGESAEAYRKEEQSEEEQTACLGNGEYNSCLLGVYERMISGFQGLHPKWDEKYFGSQAQRLQNENNITKFKIRFSESEFTNDTFVGDIFKNNFPQDEQGAKEQWVKAVLEIAKKSYFLDPETVDMTGFRTKVIEMVRIGSDSINFNSYIRPIENLMSNLSINN